MNRGAVSPVDYVCRDTDDGAYHCPLCDTPFTRRSNLRRHFQIHTKKTTPGGECCERPSTQQLQHDPLTDYPRERKSSNNISGRSDTPLIGEYLPDPASSNAYNACDTTPYFPGFNLPDPRYNNANEYSSSSVGPPNQHVLPPMNSIPSSIDFSQNTSPPPRSFGLSPDFSPNNPPRLPDFALTQPNYVGQWWIPLNTYMEEIEYPRRVEGIAMGNAMTRTQTGSTFMGLPSQVVAADHFIYDYPIGHITTTEGTLRSHLN